VKSTYAVTLIATQEHKYIIPECNSPEEATSIAEQLFHDGDMGNMTVIDTNAEDSVEEEETA
jgi:hypothetical protein